MRLGDLGALEDGWAGWTLDRTGLHDPAGRSYRLDALRAWWITCEQARQWRRAYDAGMFGRGSRGRCAAPVPGSPAAEGRPGDRGGVGGNPLRGRSIAGASDAACPAPEPFGLHRPTPGKPLSETAHHRAAAGADVPPHPRGLAVPDAGEAGAPGHAAGTGRADSPADGRRRRRDAGRSAPPGAGLVSSLEQVTRPALHPLPRKASGEVSRAR